MSISKKRTAVEELERAKEEILERLDAARISLQRAERARAAEPAAGSKIMITAKFPNSNKTYTYLALRADTGADERATWYLTGVNGTITWDHLIARVERADYKIFHIVGF